MIRVYHDLLSQVFKVVPILSHYLYNYQYFLIVNLIILFHRIELMIIEDDRMEKSISWIVLWDDYIKDIIGYICLDNRREWGIEISKNGSRDKDDLQLLEYYLYYRIPMEFMIFLEKSYDGWGYFAEILNESTIEVC